VLYLVVSQRLRPGREEHVEPAPATAAADVQAGPGAPYDG